MTDLETATSDASRTAESPVVGVATGATDEAELARMGYKQELKREWGLLQNFGISFSIISVITGVPSIFLYGLTTGGPAVMVWGWIFVACMTMMIGLAMAEICSAHPTSGGPYFWAAMLSRPQDAPFASWMTGWFNFLGQIAVTTSINYACANFISTACTFGTSFVPDANTTIGIYAAVLVSQGFINTFGVRLLKSLNNIAIWWNAVGTLAVIIAVLVAAPSHQSGKFVFRTFIDRTGVDGVGWSDRASPAYVVVIGVLFSQYSLTGFDASAHMTEETHNAAMSGSIGIIMAIGVSAVLGWALMVGLLFSIQDYDTVVASGTPVPQIFLDSVGEKGGIVLMIIVIGAMYFCGVFSITSNSRMIYAFARDGGIPGHRFFHNVDKRWKSPVRTVWLSCFLAFCLGLPSLGSSVAFSAATSITTIGLYISYAIPIALRVVYSKKFIRGPFYLDRLSIPVAAIAVIWTCFISIVFILPQLNPVNSQTLNYAIVAVGIVLTYSIGFWVISARKWFTGPVKQIEQEALGVDVMDPTTIIREGEKKAIEKD